MRKFFLRAAPPYKTDSGRKASKLEAIKRHKIVRTFIEHNHPEKLLLVKGPLNKRIFQIEKRLRELGKTVRDLPYK